MIMRVIVLLLVAVAVFAPGPVMGGRADISWVESWAIQLQNADIDELVNSTYDCVVIDYARHGDEASEYSAADIERVRKSGKRVLAYLSIGEAEDYRFYWKSRWAVGKPSFIGPQNPNWPGNYQVKYWTRGWWEKALRPYLDRILAAGFDGVYLDRIDAYWWWYEQGGVPIRRSADRMVRTVRKLATYTRKAVGNTFIVCGQNGVSILDDASVKKRNQYLADIDAVGMESLFYNVWSIDDQAYRLGLLEQIAGAGNTVFNVEYIDLGLLEKYFDTLDTRPFTILGYPADPDRELDELILY